MHFLGNAQSGFNLCRSPTQKGDRNIRWAIKQTYLGPLPPPLQLETLSVLVDVHTKCMFSVSHRRMFSVFHRMGSSRDAGRWLRTHVFFKELLNVMFQEVSLCMFKWGYMLKINRAIMSCIFHIILFCWLDSA